MSLPLRYGVALLLLALHALPLPAAFSMRIGSSARQQLEVLGGQPLYRSKASFNGINATIDVLAFDSSAAAVGAEVRRIHQLPPRRSGGAIWLTWQQQRRPRHLLLLPGNRPDNATAWLIEPEQTIPTAARQPLPEPPGFNPAPAAQLNGWIAIDRSNTLLTWHETPQPPASALHEVAATLTAHGWQTMLESDTQLLLAKEARAAVVFASSDPASHTTRLTVLLQGGAR